jgi:protein Tex
MGADTLTALEDLYLPYKPKRRTRASIAREKGLQGLADLILSQARTPQAAGESGAGYMNETVATVEDALAGARDIVAETISDNPDVRRVTREKAMHWGSLRVQKIESGADEKRVYELYYDFDFRDRSGAPAPGAGDQPRRRRKGAARASGGLERDWQEAVTMVYRPDRRSPFFEQLKMAAARCGGTPASARD